jgi:hypothetical protein
VPTGKGEGKKPNIILVLKALQLAERLTSSPPPPPTGITAEQPTADSAR